MRYPGRGRKQSRSWWYWKSCLNWEMRYPGRGRKPEWRANDESRKALIEKWDTPEGDGNLQPFLEISLRVILRNEIPRKGTETDGSKTLITLLFSIEKWDTPEGDGNISHGFLAYSKWLRNEIPRKGTETKLLEVCSNKSVRNIEKWDTPEGDGNCRYSMHIRQE